MRFRWMFLLIPLFLPLTALGATLFEGPLVSCAGPFCQLCDLMKTLNNVIRFLVSFSVIIATLMFTYAGVLYFTAAAKQDNIKKAHGIFTKVFIGLILVLVAWLVIDIIMKTFLTGSFGPWNDIQCGRWPESTVLEANTLGVQNPNDSAFMDNAPGGPYNPPAGSCVEASQEAKTKYGSTPNCDPAKQVQSFGNGSSAIQRLRSQYGTEISQCAQKTNVSPNVIIAIATLECNGSSTCNDPAQTAICHKGYGATGIGCSGVKSYCKKFPSDPNCLGVGSMSDEQLVRHIETHPGLAFCATGNAMAASHRPGESWSDTAARYNGGENALAASKSCPGYTVMQCPISTGGSPFPYCNITCGYHDKFDAVVSTAGGI